MDFNQDIVIEILLRSHAKDLVIFKTVSKLWYKLISDSKFVRAHLHLHRSCSRNKLIILKAIGYSCYPEEYMFIKLDAKNISSSAVETIDLNNVVGIGIPMEDHRDNISMSSIIASCNGLLLLKTRCGAATYTYHTLHVCNLVTRRYTPLPCPPNGDDHDLTRMWAFCYDTCVERYKVFGIHEDHVIMLTSGDEEWNNFTITIPNNPIPNNPSGGYQELTSLVYAERELHWLARTFVGYNEYLNGETVAVMNYYICSLDVKTREFRKIELPTIIAESYAIFVTSVSEGSLFFATVFHDLLDVWGLANKGNNQWTKKLSFSLRCLSITSIFWRGGMCIVGTKDDFDGTDDISGKNLKIFLHQGDELLYTDLTQQSQKLRKIANISKEFYLCGQYQFHVDSLVSWLPTKAKEEHIAE